LPNEQGLKILPFANISRVPPEITSIQRDGVNTGIVEISYPLWEHFMHLCQYAQSGFCFPGLLQVSVMMLFECQVGVHSDCQPLYSLFVETDKAIFNHAFGCVFWLEVVLVASPVCECASSIFAVLNWIARLLPN
jgi:hypothetical protein